MIESVELTEGEMQILAGAGQPVAERQIERPFNPLIGGPVGAKRQDELRAIQRIHREAASATSALLSARLKTRVALEPASNDPMAFSALQEALSVSGAICLNILQVPPLGEGLLTLDMPTCFRFIDRCLGGTGQAAVPERSFFTDIEMATLDEIVGLILSGIQRAWIKLLPEFDPSCTQRETDPSAIGIWAPTDRVLSSTFNIVSDIVTGEMKICLPYSPVAAVLPKPGSAAYAQASESTALPALQARLQKVPLQAQAILGVAEIPIRRLLQLQVGELIRVNTPIGQPIYMQIEGQTKFSARLGLVGKKCALKVEEVLPEVEEENE
jgi:flagellar motor switch protein FliM